MVCWMLPFLGSAQVVETLDFDLPEGMVKDSTFKIEYIVTNTRIPGYLDVHVRYMMQDTIASAKYLEDSLRITEMGSSGVLEPLEKQKVIAQRFDVVTILIDISSSMWKTVNGKEIYMDSAKAIVDSLIGQLAAPYAAKIFTFDENSYERTLSGENSFRNARRPASARYTHLYENVAQAIDRMADAKGQKLLIIVGDGENDHNKNLPVKITRQDLLEKIRGLDDSYVIYPIALGPKIYELNLGQIVGASKSRRDSTIHGMPSSGFFEEIKELKRWPVTHTILVKSNSFPHLGKVRLVEANLGSLRDTCSYRLGGLYNPWNEQSEWQLDALLGGAFVLLLLLIFAVYIPRRRMKDFKNKYVKQYWEVKQEGTRKYDPLTKFPFRDDDQVVVRCEHMTSLETWQFEGRKGGKDGGNRKRKNRCIYYPNKCDGGHGPGGSSDFFAQFGVFKQLFWMFMAALGAMVGWGLWALFEVNKKVYWNATMDKLASSKWVQANWGLQNHGMSAEDSVRVAREGLLNPFFEQLVLVGILAALITFFIAIAFEMGQARGGIGIANTINSVLRSLLRGFIAGLLGILVFMGFGYGQAFIFTESTYLPGLLAMILLGIAIGRVLTTRNGIRNARGMWAGIIAGFIAFHIYYLPMLLYHTRGYEGPKMFAFIVFGAILALWISLGSPSMENSELEIWTKRKNYGKVNVTALLRKNEDVTIGRGATATLRMKVRYTLTHNAPGNATQTFANLELRNEVVYATPLIFMEVNGEAVAPGERIALFDGDKITFDHTSPSHLMYREHRTGTHPKWRLRNRRDRRLRKEAQRTEAAELAAADAEDARLAAEKRAAKAAADAEKARIAAAEKAKKDAAEAERLAQEAAEKAAKEEAAKIAAAQAAELKAAEDKAAKLASEKEAEEMLAAEKLAAEKAAKQEKAQEAQIAASEEVERIAAAQDINEKAAKIAAAEEKARIAAVKEASELAAAKEAAATKEAADLLAAEEAARLVAAEEAAKIAAANIAAAEEAAKITAAENAAKIAAAEEALESKADKKEEENPPLLADDASPEVDDGKSEIPEISSLIDDILGGKKPPKKDSPDDGEPEEDIIV